jgi:uncharacterized protein YutE (UPF0331/DUF86 family)
MTATTQQKIVEKLENFTEYLNYLHQLKQEAKTEASFLSDFHLFGNTERYLQLCIQIIIDTSHLVLIDLGANRPEDNYETISALFERNIISEDLADELTRMVGLRNILVHEYGKIDRKRIYAILRNELDDLEDFQKQIKNFLKKA